MLLWSALRNRRHDSWDEIRAHLVARHSKPRARIDLAENLVLPLARYVWAQRGRDALTPRSLLSRAAENSIRVSLVRRLAFPVKSAAAYEWQVFLNTPFLRAPSQSADSEVELREVFFASGVEHRTLALAERYPELRRIWLTQIDDWFTFFRAFRRDTVRFVRRMKFAAGTRINRLDPDVSDLHNRNKAVIRVRFAGGGDWFYKPRPARQSKTWFKLLSRINREGFPYPFKIPRLLPAGEHHWMEAVRHRRCISDDQERGFWFRSGALLYLVSLLRGVDFHAGNLVCEGDQPIFVDCETLLHPETSMPRGVAAREYGLFRTGMLPLAGRSRKSVAAFGSTTFERLSARRLVLPDLAPRAAVEGFRNMHEFLIGERGRFSVLRRAAAQLRASQCRVIHRPTAHYHSILRHSLSPAFLRDPAARSAFLVQACRTPHLQRRVALGEAAALQDLDIPFFVGRGSKFSRSPSTDEVRSASRLIARSLRHAGYSSARPRL